MAPLVAQDLNLTAEEAEFGLVSLIEYLAKEILCDEQLDYSN